MEKKAIRVAYGEAIVKLGAENDKVVVLDADLAAATMTNGFKKAYPDRFIDCGIAEANMVDMAAGMSTMGLIPFCSTFAVFAGRSYDQIRNGVCYPKFNVKFGFSHAGITLGEDGGSHQAIEDIALMRVLPNMRVLVPADYYAAKAAIKLAAETPGPVYVRMGRASVPCVYEPGKELEMGRAYVLREGSDVSIVACGVEIDEALKAADLLAAEGISAEVIDAFCVKPLDEDTILASVEKTGCIVTAEEHSVIGGLGGAVAECLAAKHPAPLERVGMQDCFGTSASYEELLVEFHMDAAAIAEAAKKVISRK